MPHAKCKSFLCKEFDNCTTNQRKKQQQLSNNKWKRLRNKKTTKCVWIYICAEQRMTRGRAKKNYFIIRINSMKRSSDEKKPHRKFTIIYRNTQHECTMWFSSLSVLFLSLSSNSLTWKMKTNRELNLLNDLIFVSTFQTFLPHRKIIKKKTPISLKEKRKIWGHLDKARQSGQINNDI